jgi:murein DD-endopeptidase MepM/ murein hydrolase activator NlpD
VSLRPPGSSTGRRWPRAAPVLLAVAALAVIGVAAATGRLPGLGSSGSPPAAAASPASPSTPTASPSASGSPSASASPTASASLASPSSSSATPSSPTTAESPAPTSAVGFQLRKTVVPMGFPLPATSRFTYAARWLAARVGTAYSYNEVHGATAGGTLLRAHDGVDIAVKLGTPVLAAFDGLVIDPAARWRPWLVSRYGNVVAIQSTEDMSMGYVAIAAHLSRLAVHPGDRVTRGEVIGWTGRTGNAAGTEPHLHFELRAPFPITQRWGGIRRRLDSFDPLPSLLVAQRRLE